MSSKTITARETVVRVTPASVLAAPIIAHYEAREKEIEAE